MKCERPYKTAYKAWANGMLDVISAALVVTKNAANVDDHQSMTNTVMDLVQDAFKAGWDAAIEWCMQPEEEEVPAGTAIPSEHNKQYIRTYRSIGGGKKSMINDPRECAFYPNPTSKFQTCTLLDIPKRCTSEHACKCSFGITPNELRQSTLHAYERLASLDLTDQDYIANKYCGGKMPWKEITHGSNG